MTLDATPVYLVRHAKAGDREAWTEPDHLRPLTERGRRQAEGLVELFDELPVTRLVSSPSVRCVQTLAPLADARGMPVETDERLAEGAPVGAALASIRAAASGGAAVLCTHGDVMMLVVEELLDVGVRRRGDGPVDYRKGCTWVLDVAEGTFTSARYLAPPDDQARG